MEPDAVIRIGQEALLLALLLSAPAVGAALLIGLIVSVFQAATQIQEQTLTVAPKIAVVFVAIMLLGGWGLTQLVRFSVALFSTLPAVGH